jgi:hypothetical protein
MYFGSRKIKLNLFQLKIIAARTAFMRFERRDRFWGFLGYYNNRTNLDLEK